MGELELDYIDLLDLHEGDKWEMMKNPRPSQRRLLRDNEIFGWNHPDCAGTKLHNFACISNQSINQS